MGEMPSRKAMELLDRLIGMRPENRQNSLTYKSALLTRGKEKELEELATKAIKNLYQEIIDRYEIELDIQFIKPGKVKDFMEECDEKPKMPEMEDIDDEETIKEIHKRKLANLVIQGEAKNTKHILHSEIIKDGLEEIFGEEEAKKAFLIWDEITKIADQLDWLLPVEDRARMMKEAPEGFAGAEYVDWKPKEKEEDEEEKEYKEYNGEEEEEEDTPSESFTPIIRARGVDFAMLLHEAVKGLFEVLSLGGIPEDEEVAKLAISNTGLGDEPEDWKYGPEIASDLRDFVNVNPKIDTYPNIREELWKLMIDKDTMNTDEFLELMRGILSKSDSARTKVDALITKVIRTIAQEKEGLDKYRKDMDEYNRQLKDYEKKKDQPEFTEGEEEPESDTDKLVKKALYGDDKEEEKEETYIEYLQRLKKTDKKELEEEMNRALEAGDFEKAKIIGPFMEGQSKIVYDRELEIINEKLNPHTK
jgi:hypothetical protein